jgi:hypothetical protein
LESELLFYSRLLRYSPVSSDAAAALALRSAERSAGRAGRWRTLLLLLSSGEKGLEEERRGLVPEEGDDIPYGLRDGLIPVVDVDLYLAIVNVRAPIS